MPIDKFPSVENATEDGIVAIDGDLAIESILLAYSQGIFPWPINEQYPIAWFSPDPRGILEYDRLHISKSMQKLIKKKHFEFAINRNFKEVIYQCAHGRPDQSATWITEALMDAYIKLHNRGYAYSAETYHNGKLCGGLYGFCNGHIISGESMFYHESNASKFALINLMKYLHSKGINWIDTQMITSVVKNLGGREIPRTDFLKKLKNAM